MNQYNTMHRVKYKKVLYMVVIVNESACMYIARNYTVLEHTQDQNMQ